jgi:phage terminase large subunit
MNIETATVFKPLEQPSRYKAVCGGRGSGKSHYMPGAVVEHCLFNPGSRIVCIREAQKTLAQSAKLLIDNKIQEFGVGSQFRVLYDRIETPGGGLMG